MKGKIPIIDCINEIDGSVVLKISETFPEYETGDDVDLLVLDRKSATASIYKFFEKHFSDVGELRISETDEHSHVDFLFGGELEVRIDLIDAFDCYNKISVKSGFVAKIFKDHKVRHYGKQIYHVPSEEDDLTIRYFEYLEYFDKWPDKVKHLEYICAIEDEKVKNLFFDNTHRFIQFKRKIWTEKSANPLKIRSRREAIKTCIYSLKYLLIKTAESWLKKISI